ncbi:MAG TPA: NAD-dependent epimerase/dehydratase family protein [Woeseiaceae bacterium]
MTRPGNGRGQVLITGGAGFIGANLADRLLAGGESVVVLDDLSRPGVERNLGWLRARHGDAVQHLDTDVRDAGAVDAAVTASAFVYHFAAQVAVTTSLRDPRTDHAINVGGTLNVLEAMRKASKPPGLMFASTNKVYGALPGVGVRKVERRVEPADPAMAGRGVNETQPLDFISPYGCSKGAADQYVLDYARSFGLPAVVFRMSCIYGPHQQATSDQGWVAHFLKQALQGEPLTIYGDGHQVRDLLYIDDFVGALLLLRERIDRLSGQVFNMGGGIANTLSLLELIETAERLSGRSLDVLFAGPRPGDQPWFAADHGRFSSLTGWAPRIGVAAGIDLLWGWLAEDRQAPVDIPTRPSESRV